MKHIFILICCCLALFSCEKESKEAKEIAKIPITFDTERFDLAFAEVTPSSLANLKEKYPFMFSKRYADTFWINKIKDTLQQQLHTETKKAFPSGLNEKEDIKKLFQHLKYYFPTFKVPRVITTTSSVDYRNKVIVTDTITLISLDTYLGQDHFFYEGIQKFIAKNLKPDQIVVDLATEYAKKNTFQPKRKTFLDDLVYYGKLLYFKDKVIPFTTEAQRIGYTEDELQWAKNNEEYIWRYFVDKELLYSTNSKLPGRFINPAPFSKFYLEDIDNESPGQLGQYIGWQIVRAYMTNNTVTLQQMLNTDAETIFNNSKFKPRR